MTTVGAYEAKTHLPRLLDEVAAGGTVVITRHGQPVARLVPTEQRRTNVPDVIAAIRAARVGHARGGASIRQMLEEGRRA